MDAEPNRALSRAEDDHAAGVRQGRWLRALESALSDAERSLDAPSGRAFEQAVEAFRAASAATAAALVTSQGLLMARRGQLAADRGISLGASAADVDVDDDASDGSHSLGQMLQQNGQGIRKTSAPVSNRAGETLSSSSSNSRARGTAELAIQGDAHPVDDRASRAQQPIIASRHSTQSVDAAATLPSASAIGGSRQAEAAQRQPRAAQTEALQSPVASAHPEASLPPSEQLPLIKLGASFPIESPRAVAAAALHSNSLTVSTANASESNGPSGVSAAASTSPPPLQPSSPPPVLTATIIGGDGIANGVASQESEHPKLAFSNGFSPTQSLQLSHHAEPPSSVSPVVVGGGGSDALSIPAAAATAVPGESAPSSASASALLQFQQPALPSTFLQSPAIAPQGPPVSATPPLADAARPVPPPPPPPLALTQQDLDLGFGVMGGLLDSLASSSSSFSAPPTAAAQLTSLPPPTKVTTEPTSSSAPPAGAPVTASGVAAVAATQPQRSVTPARKLSASATAALGLGLPRGGGGGKVGAVGGTAAALSSASSKKLPPKPTADDDDFEAF